MTVVTDRCSMKIPIEKISVKARLRELNQAKVNELAESIREIGLINPISVIQSNSHYQLVAGLHRLEAVKLLQQPQIDAIVLKLDELETELAEIDENLLRAELTVLEQGEHLLRRNEIIEEKGRRAKRGGDGSNQYQSKGATVAPLLTTVEIAKDVGLSERRAQERIQIARDLDDKVKDLIRDTDVANSTRDLLLLARKPKSDQLQIAKQLLDDKPHVSFNSGNNEWYTPSEYAGAARRVMGKIDLDPASSKIANRIIKADTFYTKDDDGLSKRWIGRVWMNPPYASELIGKFTEKIVQHYVEKDIDEALVLVNNATDTAWFQTILEQASAVCFTKGRIRFIDANGNPSGAPLQGQAILYLGKNIKKFSQEFSTFGAVLYAKC